MTAHLTGLSVTGSGSISVEPDIADLQLSIARVADEPAAAFAQAHAAVSSVRSDLTAHGVAERMVSVSQVRLATHYDFVDGQRLLRGHEASVDVSATITEIERTSDVIAGAIEAGATAVMSLTFDTTRRLELGEQAQQAAVASALRKAHVYADACGVSVGEVYSIEDISHQPPQPFAGRALMADQAETALVSGSITVDATVAIRLEIKTG